MMVTTKTPRGERADFALEHALHADGALHVAGTDEAGRGPLAGPVVAAAVVLDPANIPHGLHDSKQLTATVRESLFVQILATAHVAVCSQPPAEIDRLNIRLASLTAMRLAVLALQQRPDHVLIDGRDTPPGLLIPCTAVIGGDAKSVSIAAASIIAKVVRDHGMLVLAREHPGFGWDKNMGYPSAQHRAAIARLGRTPHHRQSFAPFKNGTLDLLGR
jgi:ribonuclease HII